MKQRGTAFITLSVFGFLEYLLEAPSLLLVDPDYCLDVLAYLHELVVDGHLVLGGPRQKVYEAQCLELLVYQCQLCQLSQHIPGLGVLDLHL